MRHLYSMFYMKYPYGMWVTVKFLNCCNSVHLFIDYLFEGHASLNSHALQLFIWLELWPLSTQCDAMRDALMLQPYSCSVLLNPCGKLFQGLPCVLKVTGTVLALGLILDLTWLHAELST